MTKAELQRQFYRPICTEPEIDRIFDVQNTDDYLLKLRADTAVDHMRLFRVLRNRCLRNPDNWSLTNSFDQSTFSNYVARLPQQEKAMCSGVTAGFVFSNDPNGACERTQYGDIITVSNSLEYFLFYMNTAYLDFGVDVPGHVRLAAQRIAIRTMLKTEALDFDMDARGIIPPELEFQNTALVSQQISFIVGHEYAHHVHGHLNKNNLVEQPLFMALHGEPAEEKTEKFYNNSEQQEFEADISSLLLPQTAASELKDAAMSAISWFGYLDVFQQVSDQLFPQSPWSIRTHPEPIERLWNIYDKCSDKAKLNKVEVEEFLKGTAKWKSFFQEDIATNVEQYELYGSVYLDAPNTKWRGRELKDRVDYY